MRSSPSHIRTWSLWVLCLFLAPSPRAQSDETTDHRHHLGSSGFVAFGLALDERPDFFQLNYGYRITSKDVVSAEAITWKWWEPLGIPYGPSKGDLEERYPGYVRAFGVGAAYQRFLWDGAYVAVHALPLLKRYVDESGDGIQNGFQLFTTLRAGYHLGLFQDRLFVEPSVAVTHWPIDTNKPAEFAERDDEWPNYFLFEPGLHVGVRF
ncbi:hypothetical protein [Rubrivirga sp.]|uniref:hypothetical protein n=1 Tax=Rubrivirga sp. TaxID=1885344 RepID=UPI003C794820